jgi:hypothetical protein
MNRSHGPWGTSVPPTFPQWIWAALALGALVASPAPAKAVDNNPFAAVAEALELRTAMAELELRKLIGERIQLGSSEGANGLLLTAELLEQIGDARAENYFTLAIADDDEEAAYELFYADYLRNFRGPQRPLFAEAESHYLAALTKLRRQRSPSFWSDAVRERAVRGLVVLYQEDGIPLAWRRDIEPRPPFLFFSSQARGARSTSELDEIHDVRDLTAEALFAESRTRLNRPLTRDELRGLIRRKEPAVYSERLRFRYEGARFDLSYEGRTIQNAQVTNFLQPNRSIA